MFAIFNKELRSMFFSPLGYTVIGGFFFINSLIFLGVNFILPLQSEQQPGSSLVNVFIYTAYSMVAVISILSMRFFTEERRMKTDQLLLTSPVRLFDIVLGKYLAGLAVFAVALALSFTNVIIIAILGKPEWGAVLSSYIGLFFLGAALIAVSMFISSLTKSQMVAVVLSMVVFIIMIIINVFLGTIMGFFVDMNVFIKVILENLTRLFAVFDQYSGFTQGLLNAPTLIYYMSTVAIFVFLTIRMLEKRRWE